MFESMRVVFRRPLVKRIAAMLAGAVGGFAYYYYIGCASGTCPITGNPYISTLYGSALGYLLVRSNASKPQPTTHDQG